MTFYKDQWKINSCFNNQTSTQALGTQSFLNFCNSFVCQVCPIHKQKEEYRGISEIEMINGTFVLLHRERLI